MNKLLFSVFSSVRTVTVTCSKMLNERTIEVTEVQDLSSHRLQLKYRIKVHADGIKLLRQNVLLNVLQTSLIQFK